MSKEEKQPSKSALEAAEFYGLDIEDVPASKDGDPPSVKDVEAYAKIKKKEAKEAEEAAEAAKPPTKQEEDTQRKSKEAEKLKKGDYVCIFTIKENAGTFNAGEKYEGELVKEMLANGSIKKVE